MGLSTHILDTERGRPVEGVVVTLAFHREGERWDEVGHGLTDVEGRCKTLLDEASLRPGTYRLHFDTGTYYEGKSTRPLYPFVEITFRVDVPADHYHIPLLLAANGYSTYRGS